MQIFVRILISIVLAYLLGSVQFAIILSRAVLKKDIRDAGSGSAGATNMFRTFGAKWGVLTLLLDAAKGFLAYYLAFWIGGLAGGEISILCASLAGMAAIVGHNWPIYYGFKGGKGIATSLGVMLAVAPLIALICFVLGIGLAFVTKYMSVGSLAAILVVVVDIFLVDNWPHRFLLLFIAVTGSFQHRKNILRLIQGKENTVFSRSLMDRLRGKDKDNKRNLK